MARLCICPGEWCQAGQSDGTGAAETCSAHMQLCLCRCEAGSFLSGCEAREGAALAAQGGHGGGGPVRERHLRADRDHMCHARQLQLRHRQLHHLRAPGLKP